MVNFPVSAAKVEKLKRKMEDLGIREEDIEEKFVRSSGKGGQNVNRRATCVQLKHKPTGITVKCMKARTQALNRFLARRMLVEKIEEMVFKEKSERANEIARRRKQKMKRRKRAKEKVLKEKKITSEKKKLRKKVEEYDDV